MSTSQAPLGKREQHKQATRLSLVEAAIALFQEKGFDKVTVTEICKEAGVARRTFFRYFPSKEDVVQSCKDNRGSERDAF